MVNEDKLDKEELLKKLQDELDKLKVTELIAQMAANLASLGFKFLGLPPEQNEKFRDIKQAKLAIDGLDALIKVLETEMSAEEMQVLKSALSNLQLLFVKESNEKKNED